MARSQKTKSQTPTTIESESPLTPRQSPKNQRIETNIKSPLTFEATEKTLQ